MREPPEIVDDLERHPELPTGSEARFFGYGVMGLPFRSGHVLGLRRSRIVDRARVPVGLASGLARPVDLLPGPACRASPAGYPACIVGGSDPGPRGGCFIKARRSRLA